MVEGVPMAEGAVPTAEAVHPARRVRPERALPVLEQAGGVPMAGAPMAAVPMAAVLTVLLVTAQMAIAQHPPLRRQQTLQLAPPLTLLRLPLRLALMLLRLPQPAPQMMMQPQLQLQLRQRPPTRSVTPRIQAIPRTLGIRTTMHLPTITTIRRQ
jgi:hypothetical protein